MCKSQLNSHKIVGFFDDGKKNIYFWVELSDCHFVSILGARWGDIFISMWCSLFEFFLPINSVISHFHDTFNNLEILTNKLRQMMIFQKVSMIEMFHDYHHTFLSWSWFELICFEFEAECLATSSWDNKPWLRVWNSNLVHLGINMWCSLFPNRIVGVSAICDISNYLLHF